MIHGGTSIIFDKHDLFCPAVLSDTQLLYCMLQKIQKSMAAASFFVRIFASMPQGKP
jgi:hypothetical protein